MTSSHQLPIDISVTAIQGERERETESEIGDERNGRGEFIKTFHL